MENNFISRIHDLTGVDPDEIMKKIEFLDVDSMLELVSTLSSSDQTKAKSILDSVEPEDGSEGDEPGHVTEGILGLTSLPDLARMQQLAGLVPASQCPSQMEIEIEPKQLQPVFDGETLDLDGIMDSFERIERAVGNLRIRDAKAVRERINRLMTKLNESAQVRKRKI